MRRNSRVPIRHIEGIRQTANGPKMSMIVNFRLKLSDIDKTTNERGKVNGRI